MKVHERLDTFEVIRQHHHADAMGCGECFEDHCGKAHPEITEQRLEPNPDGCSVCWLIRRVEQLEAGIRRADETNIDLVINEADYSMSWDEGGHFEVLQVKEWLGGLRDLVGLADTQKAQRE